MKPISILALTQIQGVGIKTVEKILTLTDILEPTCPHDLIEVLKKANVEFGRIKVPDLQDAKKGWDQAHEILKLSQEQNIKIISRESSHYPECLSMIADPPVLLHVKGNIDALNKDSIAIVGTRKPSDFGKTHAKKIAGLFAKEGYVVVSGLAEGIDSAAHMGALETNGLTVAVLAHGLDSVYPYNNRKLADTIIKNNGALVSEYPFGTKIFRSSFVERDRIQSGLSLGVFVIETGIKGGTMHTVGFCEKQKRVLIVMQHPRDLLIASKQCGNTQLITDNRANIVFENDGDVNLAKEMMQKKKEGLFALKLSHQPNSLITIEECKHPIKTQELLTLKSPPQSSSLDTRSECEQPTTIKETLTFVSADKLSPSVPLAGYAQPTKKKKMRKKIDTTSIKNFEAFEVIS
jgi:DNA processing protein